MPDKSGLSVSVELMRRNPIQCWEFLHKWRQQRFSIEVQGQLQQFLFFCLCFFCNSFLSYNSSPFFVFLSVFFFFLPLQPFLQMLYLYSEAYQYQSTEDNLLGQEGNETSSSAINSPPDGVLNQNLSPVLIPSQIFEAITTAVVSINDPPSFHQTFAQLFQRNIRTKKRRIQFFASFLSKKISIFIRITCDGAAQIS